MKLAFDPRNYGASGVPLFAITAAVASTPNPSINRTCPGRPGHAGYLKRWAAAPGSHLGSRFAALVPPSSSLCASAAPRGSSSLVSQLVSRRERPARSASRRQRFALQAHGG